MSKLTKVLLAVVAVFVVAAIALLAAMNIRLQRSLDTLTAQNDELIEQLSATPEPAPTEEAAAQATSDVIAVVNGEELLKYDAMSEYESYAYYYSLYGVTDEESLHELKHQIMATYAEQLAVDQKAIEMGFDQHTDEERAEIAKTASEEYEATVAENLSYFQEDGLSEEEVRANTIAFLDGENYTLESVEQYLLGNLMNEKLYKHLTADVTLTDEALQAAYDAQLAEQQTLFTNSPDDFDSAILNGDVVLYRPEGYRAVRHILIMFSDEQAVKLAELEDNLATTEEQIAAGEGDEEALATEKKSLEDSIEALYGELMPEVETVLQKLADGEDFEALVAEYGDDEGMRTGALAETGYYITAGSETWETAFRDAAMALANVGDISEPTRTPTGIHIIRYVADVPSGAVPLDEVRDALYESQLNALREEKYSATTAEWIAAANIEYHEENMQ